MQRASDELITFWVKLYQGQGSRYDRKFESTSNRCCHVANDFTNFTAHTACCVHRAGESITQRAVAEASYDCPLTSALWFFVACVHFLVRSLFACLKLIPFRNFSTGFALAVFDTYNCFSLDDLVGRNESVIL